MSDLQENQIVPKAILFTANLSGAIPDVTGDGTIYTILFDETDADRGAGFDTVTGIFTAPKTGYYLFTAGILLKELSVATHNTIDIKFVTDEIAPNQQAPIGLDASPAASGEIARSGAALLHMTVGGEATVTVAVGGSAKTVDIGSLCKWQGYFVSP